MVINQQNTEKPKIEEEKCTSKSNPKPRKKREKKEVKKDEDPKQKSPNKTETKPESPVLYKKFKVEKAGTRRKYQKKSDGN